MARKTEVTKTYKSPKARASRTQAEADGAQNPVVVKGRDTNPVVDPGEIRDDPSGREDKYTPKGWDSVDEYLADAMALYEADFKADEQNLLEAAKDLEFTYVDQWDPITRAEREAAGRPVITINTMPQFVGQVIGDRRINQTSIKIIPARNGTVKVAETRTGLIKTIEQNSRAHRTYDMACEDQVVCGMGAFQIQLDYAYNDVFEQDIFIKPIANPLGVLWDRMSIDVTGKDAGHCFVIDEMPKKEYEDAYPDEPIPSSFGALSLSDNALDPADWVDRDTVKIVAYWKMEERPATFAMMVDGQVEDVTGKDPEVYAHRVAIDEDGQPFVRDGIRPYAVRHLITSFCILDGPYELPLTRLPVIRVSGRVGRVGTKQVRFGLVRWARDPSLLRNYWRSTAAETLAMAPKNQWIAPESAVKGREDDFRKAHLSGDPLLIFNDKAVAPPTRMDPPNLPAAVLNEANVNAQDIKDVTGIHDASLGIQSNEVSGKAIMARQREGDVATVIYHDNLNESIQEGGDVVNQLIDVTYDTPRMLRLTGPDDKHEMVKVNDPDDENSPDLSVGKYDTMVVTGPSYTTQRMEAAESMMNAIQVFPQLMEVAGDLIVEAQDWPGAQEIAARLKKQIPGAQEAKRPEDMTPEEQQELAAQQQAAQQQQELQQAAIQAEVQGKQLELRTAEANAKAAEAKAAQEEAKAQQLSAEAGMSQNELIIAEANARKAIAEADEAESKAKITKHQVQITEDDMHFTRSERTLGIKQLASPQPAAQPSRGTGSRPAARPAAKQGNRK